MPAAQIHAMIVAALAFAYGGVTDAAAWIAQRLSETGRDGEQEGLPNMALTGASPAFSFLIPLNP